MKYRYKKYLFLLVSFSIYFLLRFKISCELTIIGHRLKLIDIPFYPWSYCMYRLIFNIVFGILLGVSYLLNESSKEGVWRVEKAKLICLGIPSFLISLIEFIFFYKATLYIPHMIVEYGNIIVTLNQILFGFIFISSFYKQTSNANNNLENF